MEKMKLIKAENEKKEKLCWNFLFVHFEEIN